MLNWDITAEDQALIGLIGKRFFAWEGFSSLGYDQLDCLMDLTAVHVNGMPLDLERLLAFSDGNFLHDLLGIHWYLNRETGQLTDCFVPRCARTDHQKGD